MIPFSDMVHRDLKLENILMSNNPKDSSDHLYIKVCIVILQMNLLYLIFNCVIQLAIASFK